MDASSAAIASAVPELAVAFVRVSLGWGRLEARYPGIRLLEPAAVQAAVWIERPCVWWQPSDGQWWRVHLRGYWREDTRNGHERRLKLRVWQCWWRWWKSRPGHVDKFVRQHWIQRRGPEFRSVWRCVWVEQQRCQAASGAISNPFTSSTSGFDFKSTTSSFSGNAKPANPFATSTTTQFGVSKAFSFGDSMMQQSSGTSSSSNPFAVKSASSSTSNPFATKQTQGSTSNPFAVKQVPSSSANPFASPAFASSSSANPLAARVSPTLT